MKELGKMWKGKKLSKSGIGLIIFAIIMGVITVIINLHSEDKGGLAINLAFLAVMVGLILAADIKGFAMMEYTTKDLRILNEALRKLPNGSYTNQNPDRMWSELRLSSYSFSDSVFQHKWNDYLNNDMYGSGDKVLEDENEILSRYNSDFCDVVPGLLTAMGILGTFIGLVISMASFSGAKPENIETNIGSIVGGMNIAFYTSIYGVALSIAFNIANRRIQQSLSEIVTEYRNKLREYFAEYIGDTAMDQLLACEKEARKDVEIIRQSLKGNIGKEIGKTIGETLIPEFNSMNETLDRVVGDFRTEQYAGIAGVADIFTTKVCEGLDNHINELGASVNRLSKSQNEMTNSMNQLLIQITETMRDTKRIHEESAKIIDTFNEYLDKIDRITRKVEETFTDVNTYSKNMYYAADAMKITAGSQKATADSQSNVAKAMQQNAGELLEIVQHLKNTQDEMRTSYAGISNNILSMEGAVNDNNKGLTSSLLELNTILNEFRTSQIDQNEISRETNEGFKELRRWEETRIKELSMLVEMLNNRTSPNNENKDISNFTDLMMKQNKLLESIINEYQKKEDKKIIDRILRILGR